MMAIAISNHVHPYAYMDDWEKLIETSLHEKEDCYCNLNMEDITDANYTLTKRVFKDFEMNNLEEYHDFYVQSDNILLPDVFEKFRKMCLEIYEFNPDSFLNAPGSVWQNNLYG